VFYISRGGIKSLFLLPLVALLAKHG